MNVNVMLAGSKYNCIYVIAPQASTGREYIRTHKYTIHRGCVWLLLQVPWMIFQSVSYCY